jgi:hypothetical protein
VKVMKIMVLLTINSNAFAISSTNSTSHPA